MASNAHTRIDGDTARRLSTALEALQQQQPRRPESVSRAEFVRDNAKVIRSLMARGFSVNEIGEALRAVEPTLSDAVIKANVRSARRIGASSSLTSTRHAATSRGSSTS